MKFSIDINTRRAPVRAAVAAAVAAAALLPSLAAAQQDPAALAKASNCLTCHAVDHKVVGPAYKDVAAKYKGDPTAQAKLVDKVKQGGKGVWGPIPMPPNSPQVKDEDIRTLVKWVLSQ